jgi:hypothetical protein
MQSYRVVRLENERWRVTIVPEMGGRILQMTSKRAGLDLLRIPKAGEAGYPQVGGQTLAASSDFPLRPWEAQWRLAGPALSHAAVLEGICENGLKLERRIWLEGDWVRTRGIARNQTAQALDIVLLTRAEFEPGDLDALRVQYRSISGSAVDRAVLKAGEIPNGMELLRDQALPAGEWSLQRQGISPIVNRFSTQLSERATLTWTPKGGARAGLGVWSKRQRLETGQSLAVEADYR